MDNEVSTSLSLTIQLMIVAVVVGMLVLVTALGQNFGRQAVTTVAEVQASNYASELKAMADYGPVPTAALLAVLQKNEQAVRQVNGAAYGVTVTQMEDLTAFELLSKKVRVTLTLVQDLYNVSISPE